jgi:hypothetical protein
MSFASLVFFIFLPVCILPPLGCSAEKVAKHGLADRKLCVLRVVRLAFFFSHARFVFN